MLLPFVYDVKTVCHFHTSLVKVFLAAAGKHNPRRVLLFERCKAYIVVKRFPRALPFRSGAAVFQFAHRVDIRRIFRAVRELRAARRAVGLDLGGRFGGFGVLFQQRAYRRFQFVDTCGFVKLQNLFDFGYSRLAVNVGVLAEFVFKTQRVGDFAESKNPPA
jgi:hypothetical protein